MSVTVTNTTAGISGKTIDLLESDQTITGLKSFSRGANPPFAVNSGASKVSNLNADLLDGEEATALHALANATGTLAIANGGTGADTASANLVFAGPTSGGAAAPSFRALVAADLPGGVVASDVTATEVVSSTTETTVFTTSIGAGVLSTNKMLKLTLIGDYLNNDGAARDFTVKVKYGSTTLFNSGTLSITNGAARRCLMLDFEVAALNSASAQVAKCGLIIGGGDTVGGTNGGTAPLVSNYAVHNASTEASAGALNLVVTMQHGTNSANISARCHTVFVTLVG